MTPKVVFLERVFWFSLYIICKIHNHSFHLVIAFSYPISIIYLFFFVLFFFQVTKWNGSTEKHRMFTLDPSLLFFYVYFIIHTVITRKTRNLLIINQTTNLILQIWLIKRQNKKALVRLILKCGSNLLRVWCYQRYIF